jgi:hypothetical protein
MQAHDLTIHVDDEMRERLNRQSRYMNQPPEEVARILLEEGLRMEEHPGIAFRPGPTGRRPALRCGPDIWEVIRVFNQLESRGEDRIRELATIANLDPSEVRAAIRYYAQYPDEIDTRIQWNEREAERAEAAWLREQAVLQQ